MKFSLANRKQDIPWLISHYCQQYEGQGISYRAQQLLISYQWGSGLGEFKTVLYYACQLAAGSKIEVCHLPPWITGDSKPVSLGVKPIDVPVLTMEAMKEKHILQTYQQCNKNKTETARVLQISRRQVCRILLGHD